jgi:hypothetical protein
LARPGEEGVEAGVAAQGFEVWVGCDLVGMGVSEFDCLAQIPERLIAVPCDCRPAGEAIPGVGNRGRFVRFAHRLDRFAEQSLRFVVSTLVAKGYRKIFDAFRRVRVLRTKHAAMDFQIFAHHQTPLACSSGSLLQAG